MHSRTIVVTAAALAAFTAGAALAQDKGASIKGDKERCYGVSLAGQFGVRSEVNMYLPADEARVTPGAPQRDLIRAG